MPRAIICFADGLEECEGLLTVDLLRRAGVEVTIAAVGGRREILSSHKVRILADALLEEAGPAGYDIAILPGGMKGVANLKADPAVRALCCGFAQAGKPVAAVCAAPSALAEFGLLAGRQATVYPGPDLIAALAAGGARYTAQPVTVDGSFITGEALGATIPFALAIIAALCGQAAADKVRDTIVYRP